MSCTTRTLLCGAKGSNTLGCCRLTVAELWAVLCLGTPWLCHKAMPSTMAAAFSTQAGPTPAAALC